MPPRIINDGRQYIFPLFKFQKRKHSISMLKQGNIHLSNIKEFRQRKFGGTIDDDREGQVALHTPLDPLANFSIFHNSKTISIDDAFIFCSSSDFLSETLNWAINEGKESCVLIKNPDYFSAAVSNSFKELTFMGTRECIYSGRDIGNVYTNRNLKEEINRNNITAAWIKPRSYRNQMEVRSVWVAPKKISEESYFNRNIDFRNLFIPVEYEGVDQFVNGSTVHAVGVKITTFSGHGNASFHIQYPLEVLSPVIHRDTSNDEFMLGFFNPRNTTSGGEFDGGHIQIMITAFGQIVCNVYLEDVAKIEYHVFS